VGPRQKGDQKYRRKAERYSRRKSKTNPELDGVINRTDYNKPKKIPPDRLVKLIEQFDFVVANPMWNQDGYKDLMENDRLGRFPDGIAPA